MEPNYNGLNLDFGFAFDDVNFSDRILRIVIEHDDKTEFSSTQEKGGDAIKDNELFCNIEVRTMHISSPVLAAISPFFLKLFSNGMKESKERTATLRIHSSEEVALMDLLNFMYYNTLSSATSSSLVDVLMVADKFQVSSCIRYSVNLLCNLPMTCELALQYLHLPSIVMMPDEVQPLTDASNKYLVLCCQNFTRLHSLVDFEFSARSKPTEEFMSRGGLLNHTFSDGSYRGLDNLFEVSWSQFISPNSIYFINEVFYLKIEIGLNPN